MAMPSAFSWSTGPAAAYGGASSAQQDNSGWNVGAPGGVTVGGASLCPWVIVGGLVLFYLWRRKK